MSKYSLEMKVGDKWVLVKDASSIKFTIDQTKSHDEYRVYDRENKTITTTLSATFTKEGREWLDKYAQSVFRPQNPNPRNKEEERKKRLQGFGFTQPLPDHPLPIEPVEPVIPREPVNWFEEGF